MSLDLIGIIILLAISLAALLFFGKSVGIALIFSLPIASFLYERFPYTNQITIIAKSESGVGAIKALLFLLIVLIVYTVVRKAVSVVFPWNPLPKLFEGIVITIILTGLLLLNITQYIDQAIILSYLPLVTKLLAIPHILFWWTLGGFLSLLFILNKS